MNGVGMMMATSMGKSAIQDAGATMLGSNDSPNSHIKWDQFNYPPLIRVIHYDLTELENPQRAIVRNLHLNVLLLLLILLINLGNSLFLAIGYGKFSYITFSVLNFVVLPPIAIFAFYKGYRGICHDTIELKQYYISSGILIFIYFICSIVPWLSFHGWVAVSQFFAGGFWFQALIGIVENLLWTLNFLTMLFMIYVIRNYSAKSPSHNSSNASSEVGLA